MYRNDGGNSDSIWLTLTSDPDSDSQTEVVWFEIDPNFANSAVAGTRTTPDIRQSGSIDGKYRRRLDLHAVNLDSTAAAMS